MENKGTTEVQRIQFTPHQVAIMLAWSEHESIAKAAAALGLSESTLQTHFKRMRKKLKVSRTFDVYKYMAKKGMLL